MTETNAYGPGNSGRRLRVATRRAPVGCVPIMEIEVRDEDDQAVAAGERGRDLVQGPHVIRGYWNKPKETAEVLVDGWLRSGDIGHLDEDGFIYVEDRAKDMVLRAGENIYLAEVEAAIYEHPAVYEAAVFGVPDPRLGEQVAAAVVLKKGATLTAEELQAHVGEAPGRLQGAHAHHLLDEQLPRGATGKILKRDLKSSLYPHEGSNRPY